MKKFYLLLILSIAIKGIYAQKIDSDDMFNRIYNRSSIAFMLLSHNDEYDSFIKDNFLKETFSKYNTIDIDFNIINSSLSRNASITDKEAEIYTVLEREEAAKQIIANWFNRNEDGLMNTTKIQERGLYNATEYDKNIAEKSVRGLELLLDAGEKLIEKSYITVFDVSNVSKTISKAGILTWHGNIECYVYTIDFDNIQKQKIYSNWISSENINELNMSEVERRKTNFDESDFELVKELKIKTSVQNNTSMAMLDLFTSFLLAATEEQGTDNSIQYTGNGVAEFNDFMHSAYVSGMKNIENRYPEFIVKTAISSTSPIKAKIGKKEGLRNKDLYDVYLGKINPITNEVESQEYQGTIRASRIIDNRDTIIGPILSSKFTPIYRKKPFEQFMTLQQRNEKQIKLYFDITQKEFENSGYYFDFKAYSFGMENLNFITSIGFSGSLLLDANLLSYGEEYLSFYIRMGYLFGFNVVHPNIKFSPFFTLGLGAENVSNNYDAVFTYGASLGYQITKEIELFFKSEKYSNTLLSSSDIPALNGFGIKFSF